jgi:hypothetical protein
VYALGVAAPSALADLWTAVLYAGPGALLSHDTAAHLRGYISFAPRRVHVSTARNVQGQPGMEVHANRRRLPRHLLAVGLPVTDRPQTMLDLCARHGNSRIVRRALAQLDFRGEYDPAELLAATGRGVPGSAALRAAMLEHNPSLARLNGPLEEDLYALLLAWGLDPLPDLLNVEIAPGLRPDACFSKYGVAIETDGRANHSSDAQRIRDLGGEIAYRQLGIVLLRYDWAQIHTDPAAVYDDILRALAQAARLRGLPAPTGRGPGRR